VSQLLVIKVPMGIYQFGLLARLGEFEINTLRSFEAELESGHTLSLSVVRSLLLSYEAFCQVAGDVVLRDVPGFIRLLLPPILEILQVAFVSFLCCHRINLRSYGVSPIRF
jgi:hypothetical protein